MGYYLIGSFFHDIYVMLIFFRKDLGEVPIMYKKHRRIGHFLIISSILLFSVLLVGSLFILSGQVARNTSYHPSASIPETEIQITGISSQNAILTNVDSKIILASKKPDERIYPASMTKLMTALTVVSNVDDIEAIIEMPEDAYRKMLAENASMSGFLPGEAASVKDYLYGMLLPSGGECCICLAEYISGSEAEFVQLMNQEALALGMQNTHFANTTGLHDESHYSTSRDISILLQAVVQVPLLYEMLTSHYYVVPPTNRHPEGFTMHNTIFQYLAGNDLQSGHILGGKTGYTSKAGQCLASIAMVDGTLYSLVTAGAYPNSDDDHANTQDALLIYDRYPMMRP